MCVKVLHCLNKCDIFRVFEQQPAMKRFQTYVKVDDYYYHYNYYPPNWNYLQARSYESIYLETKKDVINVNPEIWLEPCDDLYQIVSSQKNGKIHSLNSKFINLNNDVMILSPDWNSL